MQANGILATNLKTLKKPTDKKTPTSACIVARVFEFIIQKY